MQAFWTFCRSAPRREWYMLLCAAIYLTVGLNVPKEWGDAFSGLLLIILLSAALAIPSLKRYVFADRFVEYVPRYWAALTVPVLLILLASILFMPHTWISLVAGIILTVIAVLGLVA